MAPAAQQVISAAKQRAVARSLLAWHADAGRHALPWRHTRDPYRILVSELMLQQTQVPRVVPKYEAFLRMFPTIESLAEADRAAVLRAWQGLGYNSRAVRLHTLAKIIVSERAGKLPKTREELLALPGIGPYTAGALIIFSQRVPALSVDVNIDRVLSRVFWPRNAVPAKRDIEALQLSLISRSGEPHQWHAALMDLGSAVCTARAPDCGECPLFKHCMTRGARPDAGKAPRQAKFAGSTRWWRGQILKTLLLHPVPEQQLLYRIKQAPDAADEDACAAALQAMIAEGIVLRAGKLLRIA